MASNSPKTCLSKIWLSLLDIVFPPVCFNCRAYLGHKDEKLICHKCLEGIPTHRIVFRPDAEFLLGAASDYENPLVRELIHIFKYQFFEAAADPLASLMIRYLQITPLADFFRRSGDQCLIVPIPLHPAREKYRGFNQAKLIAQKISLHFNLPLDSKLLVRVRKTDEQAKLKDDETRKKNIRNAFKITMAEELREKTIILVDDVYTSGSTMKEAARTLKKVRPARILGLVLAKA